MSDEYRIALAYSNIQRKYSIPTLISGVTVHEDDFLELEKRDLPKKKTLIQRKDSLYWLQDTFDDVSQYITCHLVVQLKDGSSLKDFQENYIKVLNILRSSHLRVIAGHIKFIIIRAVEAYDKETRVWRSVDFDQDFINKVSKFSPNLIVERGYERLLEVARILARLEYERLRSFGKEYITSKIEREPSEYLQIIKVRWDSPPIDEYFDEVVGPPALVIRSSNPSSIHHIYPTLGTKLSFSPLTKFCRGGQNGRQVLPCEYCTENNPFGLPLIGSSAEQCHKCRKLFEYSICLYRKPLCNGYEVKCGNKEFAGNICCGLFALYVIRFGTDLKVGTAILSNVVGRLLEQGAGFALVVYPLEGIMTAHILEKVIKNHLAINMQDFRHFKIENVYRRAPPKEARVRDVLQDWDRNDKELLDLVGSKVSEIRTSIDGLEIDLSRAEHKICRFVKNYVPPTRRLYAFYLKPKQLYEPINGSIVGYRGSFLFLNSGKVVDIKGLQGFVVRGSM